MGGICSRSSNAENNPFSAANAHSDRYKSDGGGGYQSKAKTVVAPPPPMGGMEEEKIQEEKQLREPVVTRKSDAAASYEPAAPDDDFYDGIPRYPKTMTQKSRSVRSMAKVSEVSSRLGRAGTAGLGKAVDVLDTLGSSMTNFNSGNGFASAAPSKGTEIAILSFEIANTIVKGSNLMQSLSMRSIRQLKEAVLPSKGVQYLVSKDTDELLNIVAADKREDLKIFTGEVVRFGNRCKDPQWHNLDRYFEKISRGLSSQKNLKDEAASVMQQLMTLVQFTAELYHELHAFDRFKQDYERKQLESSISNQKGDNTSILKAELKSQKKILKNLKKKSLWSKSLEEVMEKLVDIVHFLYLEIQNQFGGAEGHQLVEGSTNCHQRLGPAGLSLHYANIIIQIDTLVARSSSVPSNTRDALYQNLPPSLKSSLRSKLKSFHVKEELSVKEIKDEMEKTLEWLVPVATNTAKAHHGFGWVGEWASTGSEGNRKQTLNTDVIRIETLHHADRDKTDLCVLEMLLWLHHLVTKTKSSTNPEGISSTLPTTSTPLPKANQEPKDMHVTHQSSTLTPEDEDMLQRVTKKQRVPRISKSQDFDAEKISLRKRRSLARSSSHSPGRRSKEVLPLNRLDSGLRGIDFGIDKKKVLDIMDRLDTPC
ncbi:hypothetical protein UlMin_037366 [Ulmus minor]